MKLSLRNLPKAVKIVIAVLPSAILAAAVIYFGVLPKNQTIAKLKEDIAQQEQDISKAQSMVQKLDELKAENERLRAELKALEEYLPEEKEISSLLKQVEDLSREAGLNINTWTPSIKRMHASGIIYEVPVSISLTGSYHKLGLFFSSLTQLNRIVNVNNINMGSPQPPKGGEAVLSVSFSAVTFTAIPAEGAK